VQRLYTFPPLLKKSSCESAAAVRLSHRSGTSQVPHEPKLNYSDLPPPSQADATKPNLLRPKVYLGYVFIHPMVDVVAQRIETGLPDVGSRVEVAFAVEQP